MQWQDQGGELWGVKNKIWDPGELKNEQIEENWDQGGHRGKEHSAIYCNSMHGIHYSFEIANQITGIILFYCRYRIKVPLIFVEAEWMVWIF